MSVAYVAYSPSGTHPSVAEQKQTSPASYADFSDAEGGGWLRTAVQFFAIPLLIVCVAVGLYLGISLMVGTGPKSVGDFVELLQADTINRRWQAAYELATRLQGREVPAEFRDPRLVRALGSALESARAEDADPPQLAVVILGLLGRLGDPESTDKLVDALDDENAWIRSHAIRALGSLGDTAHIDRIRGFAHHDDHGTRQSALAALARLDQVDGLKYRLSSETRKIAIEHLGDRHEDVRFTAALVLAEAREGESALPVLRKMISREYLERFPLDTKLAGVSQYQVHSNVILKAVRALVIIECDDAEVLKDLAKLTDDDIEGDPEVRQRAREALRRLQGQED